MLQISNAWRNLSISLGAKTLYIPTFVLLLHSNMNTNTNELETDFCTDFLLGLEGNLEKDDLLSDMDQLLDDNLATVENQNIVFPIFTSEWRYKRGTKKAQQYWVYCEESQFNYIKWDLQCNNLLWNSNSRVMKRRDDNSGALIFVENISEGPVVRGFALEPGLGISFIESFCVNELEVVPASKLQFEMDIVADSTEPHHPNQGSAASVECSPKVWPSSQENTAPFAYFATVQFSNRTEGWFRLQAKLKYNDQVYIEAESDTFMLNNPRMKKHNEFQNIPASHVKFMLLYNSIASADLISAGHNLGYSITLISQLMSTARNLFASVIYCGKRDLSSFVFEQPHAKRNPQQCIIMY
jgi:hypothetical protein